MQVKLGEREREVLQGVAVGVVGVELHTHAVGSGELEVGLYALIVAKEYKVVLVGSKLLVAQYGRLAIEVQQYALGLHGGSQSEP